MPLYDFECKACGGSFEELIRDAGTSGSVVCAHCGSSEVERKLSSFFAAAAGASKSGPSPRPGGGRSPRGGGCGGGRCGCH